MKIFLVGITCSSHDVMLSVFLLKSALLASDLDVDVKIGHYIHVLAHEFDERCKKIVDDIISTHPDVVGFSVYTWNIKACERIAELVKQVIPVTIIFGGPEMSDKYHNPNVDKIIVGEGEQKIVELLGGKFTTVPSPYLSGLVPDDLLQRDKFNAVIETQRGCSFRCAYCQYHRNFPNIRYLDIDRAISEIKYVYEHGVGAIRIADGNFLSSNTRAISLIRTLTELGVKVPLYFEFIPSFVYRDFADVLKEYGAPVTVGIGQQSINPEVLKLIKRNTSLESLKKAYELMEYAGATVSTDLILGLPLETRDSFISALDFVIQATRKGKHFIHVSVLLILPDTEMEQIIKVHPPTMSDDDITYCAKMVAAAYRVLNSDMREKFYNAGGTLEILEKITKYVTLGDDLECYWNFDVLKDVTDYEIETALETE